jgi:hypothetical protein
VIAAANLDLVPVVRNSGFTHASPYWIFSPALGLYTYMPFGNRRSPYGFSYRGIETYVRGGGYYAGSSSGDSDASRSSPSSGNPASGSSGTFNSSGERTFGTPSGSRSTPGEYQQRKTPAAAPVP